MSAVLEIPFEGERTIVLDFGPIWPSLSVSEGCCAAFKVLYGKYSREGIKQAWRSIRNLAKGVKLRKGLLPVSALATYRRWLTSQELEDSTRQSHFNVARAMLTWLSVHRSKACDGELILTSPGFLRQTPES